ncbi:MAG: histidine phosphatase family protein [Frankiaceae bacterium]
MPEIVVVRHGETEWSRARRHTGRIDLPLTPAGERAAGALRPLLAGRSFGLVLVSPLQRASRTAELAGLDGEPDADLMEWDYGAYEGLTTEQVRERLGRPWSLWDDGVAPGATPGESIEDVAARVRRVIARAEPVIDAGSDVALVAHGHSLRILAACWLGLEPRAGAVLVLGAGAVGTLGHEHGWHALTGWNQRPGPAAADGSG